MLRASLRIRDKLRPYSRKKNRTSGFRVKKQNDGHACANHAALSCSANRLVAVGSVLLSKAGVPNLFIIKRLEKIKPAPSFADV